MDSGVYIDYYLSLRQEGFEHDTAKVSALSWLDDTSDHLYVWERDIMRNRVSEACDRVEELVAARVSYVLADIEEV